MCAGFFVRVVAYLIDSLIAFIAGGIIKAPFKLAAGAGLTALKANFIFQHSFIDVIGYVGMVSYFILMTYLTHTTLGKMLFNLEVVTKDGEWTFLNILYRETVGRFLSDILCIGYLAVIVSASKQGFHDMLCDTYVVYKNMQRIPSPVKVAVAGGGSIYADGVYHAKDKVINEAGVPEKEFGAIDEQRVPEKEFGAIDEQRVSEKDSGAINIPEVSTAEAGSFDFPEASQVSENSHTDINSAFVMPEDSDR